MDPRVARSGVRESAVTITVVRFFSTCCKAKSSWVNRSAVLRALMSMWIYFQNSYLSRCSQGLGNKFPRRGHAAWR